MAKKKKQSPIVNRDLSWLSFNDRVLQEAEDTRNPLIERLRFLGIYSNNRDEFFRVRVATIRRVANLGKKGEHVLGEAPQDLLNEIQRRYLAASRRFDSIYKNIIAELEGHHIHIIDESQLDAAQGLWVKNFFDEQVLPNLFPIMLDTAPSFPYLKDKSIYLCIQLLRVDPTKKNRFALMEVPTEQLSRFVVLPSKGKELYVMLLDDVIRYCLSHIFPTHEYRKASAYTIKLTRDAELDIDHDLSKSFLEKISGGVKKRGKGMPVRFVYDKNMPQDLLQFLLRKLKVINKDNIIPGSRYHNFKDFISFPHLGHTELVWPAAPAQDHPAFSSDRSMFSVLQDRDVILHFPYQSFHHIIDLLREASIDPKVKKIQISLYRVARNSNIVNALINALKNGKEVVAVVELQARFDEENNIYWSNRLQEEGAKVIYGVPGLKVHSKLFMITRREENKLVNYVHVGSGNMNESTAKIYTDKSLLTRDPRITEEVARVFEFYNDNLKPGNYKHLLVSPFNMRKKLIAFIDNEIDFAKKGKPAKMWLKMNNLVDPEMIHKLYAASQAGVQIKLIVRGICSLVPGIKGFSENIEAISIVGRYLEHSRVFIFHNNSDEKYFISSADWMSRNLDTRSEVAVPIYDPQSQRELKELLELQLKDNVKARHAGGTHENDYVKKPGKPMIAQQVIRGWLAKQDVTPPKKKVEIRRN